MIYQCDFASMELIKKGYSDTYHRIYGIWGLQYIFDFCASNNLLG
jgi:hypothetical protein